MGSSKIWIVAPLSAAGLLLGGSVAPALAGAPQGPGGVSTATFSDSEIAARALDTSITWKDLDPVLLHRRVMSHDGRESLRHLAKSRVLELLARERGITVKDSQIDARLSDLDRQVRASGDPQGIAGMMRKARLSPEEFRRFLRLSFVQETLTRRALGLPDSVEVKGDQQELWMEEVLREHRFVELVPPWKDGVVARASDFEIRLDELLRALRQRLPEADLREDCYQLLLEKRMRARMPDLAPERLDRYVVEEIARRREEVAADPRYKAIPYEKLLSAQGILIDSLPQDPSIRVAALSRAWVDRTTTPDGLRRAYEAERARFDAQHGAAVETWMIFLRGARFRNELNPRTFQESESELERLRAGARTLEDFQRLARERSEEAGTRASGGALGFVGPGSERVPEEIRARLAVALAAPAPVAAGTPPGAPGAGAAPGGLVGPLRVANGAVLLWLGERRTAPAWEEMAAHVHRELRRRFVEEVLPKSSVATVFEVP